MKTYIFCLNANLKTYVTNHSGEKFYLAREEFRILETYLSLNLENTDGNICQLNRTSEGFNVTVDQGLNNYAQSRQTGEGFRSAAPPDCRINVC